MILTGKEVVEKLNNSLLTQSKALAPKIPTLAIVRMGEDPSDIAYENGAVKRAEAVGVAIKKVLLPREISAEELKEAIWSLNKDIQVDGVLIFRPFPEHLRAKEQEILDTLEVAKDVDGVTTASMAALYGGSREVFPPCTAAACMKILEHFRYELTGQNVVVLGRSLVVGKPLSMLLLDKNATVTICHSKSKNLPSLCKKADILIAAVGKAEIINDTYVTSDMTVIDVGINYSEIKGKIVGDVDREKVENIVKALTPVPGGVGTVTTTCLMEHVIKAAGRANP